MAGLMLECVICSGRRWLELTAPQTDDVKVSGATLVGCESCGRDTYWKFAESGRRAGFERRMESEETRPQLAEVQRAIEAKKLADDHRTVSERRQASLRQNYRVPLKLPIRVRSHYLPQNFEEITTSINVCRNGVYFASRNPHSKGAFVYVTMNYSPNISGSNIEQLGTVVRLDKPADPSEPVGVAVRFSEDSRVVTKLTW